VPQWFACRDLDILDWRYGGALGLTLFRGSDPSRSGDPPVSSMLTRRAWRGPMGRGSLSATLWRSRYAATVRRSRRAASSSTVPTYFEPASSSSSTRTTMALSRSLKASTTGRRWAGWAVNARLRAHRLAL